MGELQIARTYNLSARVSCVDVVVVVVAAAGWMGAGRWTDPSCCLRGGDDVEKLVRRKVACWTCGWQTAMRKESERFLCECECGF